MDDYMNMYEDVLLSVDYMNMYEDVLLSVEFILFSQFAHSLCLH